MKENKQTKKKVHDLFVRQKCCGTGRSLFVQDMNMLSQEQNTQSERTGDEQLSQNDQFSAFSCCE